MLLKTYDDKNNKDIIVSFGCLFGGVLIISAMPFYGYVLAGCGAYLLARRILKMDRFTALFKQLGLHAEDMYPELKEVRRTDYSVIRRYSLPPGLGLQDFEEKHNRMEDFIGKKIDIKCHAKNIILEIFNNAGMEHFNFEYREHDGLKVELGRKRNGRPVISDMLAEPHLLIGGQTGGGKTNGLKCTIVQYILKDNALLDLIDLKGGADFHAFESSDRVTGFGRTKAEAVKIIASFLAEIHRRYQLFYDSRVKDIVVYYEKISKKLPYRLLIIDEYASLIKDKTCVDMLFEILNMGRAAGCFTIIATQHPSREVIPGVLKENFCQTIAYRTKNATFSDIILAEPGAEKLTGKGHGLFLCGDITEFQAPFITDDMIEALIGHTEKEPKQKVLYGGFR